MSYTGPYTTANSHAGSYTSTSTNTSTRWCHRQTLHLCGKCMVSQVHVWSIFPSAFTGLIMALKGTQLQIRTFSQNFTLLNLGWTYVPPNYIIGLLWHFIVIVCCTHHHKLCTRIIHINSTCALLSDTLYFIEHNRGRLSVYDRSSRRESS